MLIPPRAAAGVPSLIATGTCGEAPPTAWFEATSTCSDAGAWWPGRLTVAHYMRTLGALVLAWEGTPIASGLHRARTALVNCDGYTAIDGSIWQEGPHGYWTLISPTLPQADRPMNVIVYITYAGRAGDTESPQYHYVSALDTMPPSVPATLRSAWALATACAARGLGTVVIDDVPRQVDARYAAVPR